MLIQTTDAPLPNTTNVGIVSACVVLDFDYVAETSELCRGTAPGVAEVPEYSLAIANATRAAFEQMGEKAKKMKASRVVGAKVEMNSLGGRQVILVYGTAVKSNGAT